MTRTETAHAKILTRRLDTIWAARFPLLLGLAGALAAQDCPPENSGPPPAFEWEPDFSWPGEFGGAIITGQESLWVPVHGGLPFGCDSEWHGAVDIPGEMFIPIPALVPVTGIGNGAFRDRSIASVSIPNSVTSIGNYAFYGCTIASVMIPNNVTNIGSYAFYGCRIASFVIPGSVTIIGEGAFASCTNLTEITVDEPNSNYSSLTGVLFNESQNTLIQCPGGKIGSFTIPSSVTRIGSGAFLRCIGLTSITVPDSVTSIAAGAFASCPNLRQIFFQGNAPSVGEEVSGTSAIVYYLPGKKGWGSPTFAGSPAVLWNPQVLTSDSSFGVRADVFGFTISGASGWDIVVEASENLDKPAWHPVGKHTLTAGGTSDFRDPLWKNHAARFYRLTTP